MLPQRGTVPTRLGPYAVMSTIAGASSTSSNSTWRESDEGWMRSRESLLDETRVAVE